MVGSNGQLLATPPKEPPLQAPVCKSLLTTGTVSGLVSEDRMYPQVGKSFSLCSISCPCSSFSQERFLVKIFEMGAWHHSLERALAQVGCGLGRGEGACLSTAGALYRFYLPLLCAFLLNPSPLGLGSLLFP